VKTLKPRVGGSRPSADDALRVAREAAPSLPPATVADRDSPTTLNLRMRLSTVTGLTKAAQERGLTIKQIVAQALAEAGLPVAPADLEDRTPRRGRRRDV